MNAVRRTIGKGIVIGSLVGLVSLALVAQAGAYLFGFNANDGTGAVGPTYSALSHVTPGDYTVGIRRFGPEEDAPLKMTVWYPATAAAAAEPPMTYSYGLSVLGPNASTALATYKGVARLGAAPDSAGPYPLVVLSSGFAITPVSYAWLAEHLASYGMVVVAPQHEETLDPRNLWRAAIDRVEDIASTRAYLESAALPSGALAGLVDPATVALLGHSYGGYTALAAGGARLDSDAFTAGCDTAREDADPIVFLCDALEPQFDRVLDALTPGSVTASAPVDAVVSLAGDAAMFGEPGLASLTAPLLVIGGTADHDSPFNWSTRLAYDGTASARKGEVALDGAEHFVFSGRCGSVRRIVVLVPMGFCEDPAWERAQAQAVVKHFVTAFLLAELTANTEAKSAMSPISLALPRVHYRSAGY